MLEQIRKGKELKHVVPNSADKASQAPQPGNIVDALKDRISQIQTNEEPVGNTAEDDDEWK